MQRRLPRIKKVVICRRWEIKLDDTMLLKIMFWVIGGIISGAFWIAGLYYLNKKRIEKKCTCKTYGKIIMNIRRKETVGADRRRDRVVRWYSLCEYAVGEEKCVRETNIGTLQPREVGKNVMVFYNPDNCHESYIEGDNNSGIKAIVALILGIISVIFIYFIMKSIS